MRTDDCFVRQKSIGVFEQTASNIKNPSGFRPVIACALFSIIPPILRPLLSNLQLLETSLYFLRRTSAVVTTACVSGMCPSFLPPGGTWYLIPMETAWAIKWRTLSIGVRWYLHISPVLYERISESYFKERICMGICGIPMTISQGTTILSLKIAF